MAIGPGYKTFTFDGQNSGSYDVYITGEAVYNAPERTVEMITIPGRDGDLALDKGCFENIPVKYPAGMFGDDQSAFAAKVRAFRNMMASRVGYCRLEDEYNPDEYRLAVYKNGLEVEPVPFQRAGEFEILFDCNPFRFLKSGEAAVAVTNNGTLTNPTLFESKPLLEVKGSGNINLGNDTIKVTNPEIGTTEILPATTLAANWTASPFTATLTLETDKLNAGDEIDVGKITVMLRFGGTAGSSTNMANWRNMPGLTNGGKTNTPVFYKGTAGTFTATGDYTTGGYTFTLTISVAYDGADEITINIGDGGTNGITASLEASYGRSSKPSAGNPMYIDLDLGEAWNEDYSTPVSVNDAVQMPAELPTLKPGANTITYDNTITSLKIVPRWREL